MVFGSRRAWSMVNVSGHISICGGDLQPLSLLYKERQDPKFAISFKGGLEGSREDGG